MKGCEFEGCTKPVRRRRGARYCSRHAAKLGKRTCQGCDIAHPVDMMSTRFRCRSCQSLRLHASRVQKLYGITAEQYVELLRHQGGACWICQRQPGIKRLAVDHDHATGLVRGLLCKACNRDVLGHLRDSTVALRRAVEYLLEPPARTLWGADTPGMPTPPKAAGEGAEWTS